MSPGVRHGNGPIRTEDCVGLSRLEHGDRPPGAKCVDSHCFANNCFALQTSRKRARKVTSALAAIHVKQLTNLRPQNSASFWDSWPPDQIAPRPQRACIGSPRDARQAGNMQATTPTSNNVSLTAAKTVGSRTSVL